MSDSKRSYSVLIVDDSPVIRSVIRIYLRDYPFFFKDAGDAKAALQHARQTAFALVIADIKMPGMDGVTFLGELRKGCGATPAAVPVILLTGETSGDWQRRATDAGANAFLKKPVSSAGLTDVVRSLLPVRSSAAP